MTVAETAPAVDAVIERLRRASGMHALERAWTEGLRSARAPGCRNRILEAAGSQLDVFGETPGDHLRRSWLSQVVAEVRTRGEDSLGVGLSSVAAAEMREAFDLAVSEFGQLRTALATGETMDDYAVRLPLSAERIRDLGRMAGRLRGSGLMALVSREEAGLARDLAAAMAPANPLPATVPEPWRVNRDELLGWPEAPGELPRLVRSLIAETVPSADWTHMPAGSGVFQPDWDGVVRCSTGNRFVPDGKSVWELSAQQNGSDRKARSDYDKRVEDTPYPERAETAYVAAICAPWTKARSFQDEKSDSGDFRLVQALNVDNLEAWLECAPLTTVWLREQMDRPVTGAGSLSAWWARWLESTTVPLDAPVVLAGRDEQAEALRDRIRQRGGVITVGGRVHRDEILAFVAAALVGSDASNSCSGDALHVYDIAEARRLMAGEALSGPGDPGSRSPAMTIVVPSADFAGCLPAGSHHRLIVPLPGRSEADIVLEPVDSEAVAQAFEAVSKDTHTAHDLGALARRSLVALCRRLAVKPGLNRPSWAGDHIEATIRRSLLLNSWNETGVGDRRIVERFVECSYEDATEALRRLDPGDAPMTLLDEQWHVVSPADAWTLVSGHLTRDDIEDFGTIAHEVLTEPDPFYGMSDRDSMIARYKGTEATHSHQLRSGVANTLALLGSHPPQPRSASAPFAGAADGIVYRILQAANDDPSPRLWAAVTRELPLLAEAAPSAVLRGLRTCISESHAFAAAMFADNTDDDTLFGPDSPHLDVIEALETLAWSPDHLNGSVDVLASLAAIDPGGTWANNRPSSSLGSIMYGWSPHTSADADARLQAIEMLRERHGPVAWDLMLSMLPEGHGPQTVERGPLHRDWKRERVVTMGEYRSVIDSVGRMLVEDAGADSDRWAALVSRIGSLTADARRALVDALSRIAASDPGEPFRSAVWPELRQAVEDQREHFDTDWVLPESELDAFDPLLEHLRPAAPAIVYGWLFSSDLMMVDGIRLVDDHDAHAAALAAKRTAAIEEILADGGVDAVLELIETTETSYALGMALASQDPAPDNDVLEAMHDASEPVAVAALTYFESRFRECGWDLVDRLIADHAPSERVVADLLRAVPAVETPWRRAGALGAGVTDEYWRRVGPLELGLSMSSDQLREVSERLRNAGRVGAAIRLVCVWERRHDSTPEVAEETASCLEGWLQQEDPQDPVPVTRRDLSRLMKMLDRHRDHLGIGRVAILEWQYLPSLACAGDTGTPNLHRHLAQDPDFFVSLVEIAYPSASSSPDDGRESDETVRQRALSAHRLLRSWPRGTFSPGSDGQQSVDAERLDAWVDQVRCRLEESDRRGIGDTLIGVALAASPPDPDGEWPSAAVRDLIEQVRSDDLDGGMVTARHNQRGGTTRSPTDGGDQERELVAHYREQRRRFDRWPRTAAIFDSLASIYEDEAAVNDRRAEARRRGL